MHHRIAKLLLVVLVLALASACGAKHSSMSVLYTEDVHVPGKFSLVKTKGEAGNPSTDKHTSGNPIFLQTNKIYDLVLDEVRPGWVHLKDGLASSTSFTAPAVNDKYSQSQVDYLKGRELWIVTEITKKKKDDAMGLSSGGNYITASNVKNDMFSYGAIPLSKSEREVFHIDQTSDYEIKFKIYEVDGLNLKKTLAKIYSNPGIYGIGGAVIDTIWDIFKSIVGPTLFHTDDKGTLLIEQALLASDGTLEFVGIINILRTDEDSSDSKFLLYDVVKSDPFSGKNCVLSFHDNTTYDDSFKAMKEKCGTIDFTTEKRFEQYTYIRFSVKEWKVK